ncbi:MAG TPA: hypothetical protein VGC17_06975 [Lactovum miscens]|uniref:hypothetical protein n=1 Tax=Lactovum miscens TaxID=190387 RepID=UPI002EDB95FC
MIYVRLVIFVLSLFGYSLILKEYLGANKRLSYIEVICSQIIILYFSSLFGILNATSWLLLIGGLICLIIFLILNKANFNWLKIVSFDLISIGMILFVILFGITLWNMPLIHYDNFTHWATIVKFLYTENHLPGLNDKIITYNTYPVGSSVYLYFAAKIIGYKDGVLLLAQFLLISASLYGMFSNLKDDKRLLPASLIFSSFGLFNIFNFSIRTNNLLVDFILPLLALASISGIFAYSEKPIRMSIHMTIVLSALSIVKTSASFFIIISLVFYIFQITRYFRLHKNNNKFYFIIPIVCSLPFLTYQSWKVHVNNVFHGMENGKHEIKNVSLNDILQGHLTRSMLNICKSFWRTIFSFDSFSSRWFFIIFCAFSIFSIVYGIKFKKWKINILSLVFSLIIVITYYIGILLMFLLAMPIDEASKLDGFERYVSSTLIFITGFLIIIIVRQIDLALFEQNKLQRGFKSFRTYRNKQIYQLAGIGAVIFFIGSSLSEVNGMNFQVKQDQPLLSDKITQLVKYRNLTNGKILVVSADKTDVDSYYLAYLSKYELWNPNVDVRYDFIMSGSAFKKLLHNYNYVLLLDDHYTFIKMSERYLGKDLSPGIYSSKYLLKIPLQR